MSTLKILHLTAHTPPNVHQLQIARKWFSLISERLTLNRNLPHNLGNFKTGLSSQMYATNLILTTSGMMKIGNAKGLNPNLVTLSHLSSPPSPLHFSVLRPRHQRLQLKSSSSPTPASTSVAKPGGKICLATQDETYITWTSLSIVHLWIVFCHQTIQITNFRKSRPISQHLDVSGKTEGNQRPHGPPSAQDNSWGPVAQWARETNCRLLLGWPHLHRKSLFRLKCPLHFFFAG